MLNPFMGIRMMRGGAQYGGGGTDAAMSPMEMALLGGYNTPAQSFSGPGAGLAQFGATMANRNNAQLANKAYEAQQSELQNVMGTFQKNLQTLGAQPGDANAIRRAYLQTIGDPKVGLHMSEPVWQQFNKNTQDILGNATGKTTLAKAGDWGIDENGNVKFKVPAAPTKLGPGEELLGPDNKPIASMPAKPSSLDELIAQGAKYGIKPEDTVKGIIGQRTGGTVNNYDPSQPLPPAQEAQASMIARYAAPVPSSSGFGARSAAIQNMVARAHYLNPDLDAKLYQQYNKGYQWATSGKGGDQMRFFNAASYHLGSLQAMSAALDNHEIPVFNAIAQEWSKQTGQPAPTNFDTAKQIVGNEILKAISGTGVQAEASRARLEDDISKANSPEQLNGVINTAKTLLAGQIRSFGRQYQIATGLDFSKSHLVDPDVAKWYGNIIFDKGGKGGSVQNAGNGTNAAPTVGGNDNNVGAATTPTVPDALQGMSGLMYNAKTQQFRDGQGNIYDATGKAVTAPQQAPANNNGATTNQQ